MLRKVNLSRDNVELTSAVGGEEASPIENNKWSTSIKFIHTKKFYDSLLAVRLGENVNFLKRLHDPADDRSRRKRIHIALGSTAVATAKHLLQAADRRRTHIDAAQNTISTIVADENATRFTGEQWRLRG